MSHIGTRLIACIVGLLGGSALAGGCLERPIATPPPRTSNTFVDQLAQTKVDKIDLLFVIDNSSSMADKQKFLASAVPQLLRRLVNPDCVNHKTGERTTVTGADVACPTGYVKDFSAIDDIHIGVVTSSLGGHGGDACAEGWRAWNPTEDDHAHLLPSVRDGVPNNSLGFLAWDPKQKATPPGTTNLDTLTQDFTTTVKAVGEVGCGYEATLESWYRFLIDPDPPARVTFDGKQARVDGTDQTVLNQRRAFLRPDSLLAIIMLSDENDCSVIDGGAGYVVASDRNGTFRMPSATSACSTNPNDPCCRSCAIAENTPPSGCKALTDDPGCAAPRLTASEDPPNLRCFQEKRRFGIDLLYPTDRYVQALKSPTIKNRAGQAVSNPIFTAALASGVLPRDEDLVFLAGIVGVPWQDIATDASLTSKTELTYLTADQLTGKDRWSMILGDPKSGVEATDPLMHESVAPRSGNNPVTGAPLVGPQSTDPRANPINGHEYNATQDLQYACTFELPETIDCATAPADNACDCSGTPEDLAAVNNPLCNPVGGGAATTVQTYAKAYPGLRHLEVLRGFGKNGIVASICPKITGGSQATDPSYGYNPAVQAIVDRLGVVLRTRCLPRELTPDPTTDRLPCAIVEATRNPTCQCTGPGYVTDAVPQETRMAVERQLESTGICSMNPRTPDEFDCDAFCFCSIAQTLAQSAKQACENEPIDTIDPNVSGYCYIDPAKNIGNPALVSECPAGRQRMLRFVGKVPAPKSYVFMACAGTSYYEHPSVTPVDAGLVDAARD